MEININITVVVWLKFGKHDINDRFCFNWQIVVVWLKFGKHDINWNNDSAQRKLWFD